MGKFWTEKDRGKFKELYPTLPYYKLINIFNRTHKSIEGMATTLKLHKKNGYKRVHIVKKVCWANNKDHPSYYKLLNNAKYSNHSYPATEQKREKCRIGTIKHLAKMKSTVNGRKKLHNIYKKISSQLIKRNLTHLHTNVGKKYICTEKQLAHNLKQLKEINETKNLKSKSIKILKELRKYQD